MANNPHSFIGIDVSKDHFDASLLVVLDHKKQSPISSVFHNTPQGIQGFHRWLTANGVTMDGNSLVVMENTGIYHRLIWSFCSQQQLPLHIGNAAHIKWSFGIARGKNDKIDSIRLANYAFKEADALRASAPLDRELLLLKDLIAARTKLLKQRGSISVTMKELECGHDGLSMKIMEKSLRAAIDGIAQSILSIEQQIRKLINSNRAFRENYDLLMSIPGIGKVTATYLISCTANFAARPTGKQLACYAGVVPFEHTSGSSIRGRTRVHRMANKELKRLLHMGAMSVKNNNREFREYFIRKKEEGKHSMSILNAIKNKLALRIAAVIRDRSKYMDRNKAQI